MNETMTWVRVTTVGAFLLGVAAGGRPSAAHDEAQGGRVGEPVVDIAAKIKAAEGDHDGAECVVVYEETQVEVAASGLGTNTHRRVVKILKDGGIRNQSTQRWRYDPLTNELELKAVNVHRKGGSVETMDLSTAVVQPAPAGIIFWGEQQITINIPKLNVGDSIETLHVKSGFNTAYLAGPGTSPGGRSLEPPMPGHWYDVVDWQEDVPILEKVFSVRIPRDKPLQYEVLNGSLTSLVRFDGDHLLYRFEKKDIPAFSGEANMVARSDVICKLVLATLEDWHAKARWFYEANEESFKTDEALGETVREIVAGLDSDEEKIAALNHWVAENVRYVGTTRGACEGYTTHPATQTFHDRGGVCKDKAGLLVAMLRVAGFDSYIVMTMAGSRVEETPADQFNHAVTCIKKPDGTIRLLDPTWLPKSREMWSSAEQLQTVVFGTPDGAAGKRLTDYSPPEDNAAVWESKCTLLPTGELYGRIRVSTIGCPETQMRRTLAGFHPKDRPGRIESSLRSLSPAAALVSVNVTDPVDFSGPAVLEVDFAATDYALGDAERPHFRLPSLSGALADVVFPDLRDSAGVEADKRKYAARIRSTRRIDVKEAIELPSGLVARNLPDDVVIEGPAADLRFSFSAEPGLVRYECRLDVKKHRVPVEDYANYKEAIDKLLDLGKRFVVCEREEQRAQR